MLNIIKYIERAVVVGIMLTIMIVLVLSFADIIYEIKQKILKPPYFIIDANGLMDLFSLILLLLIGIELLETVKTFLKKDSIQVQVIIVVAIIAIARKVIVWDFEKYTFEELISLAVMIIALSVSYVLLKKKTLRWPKKSEQD